MPEKPPQAKTSQALKATARRKMRKNQKAAALLADYEAMMAKLSKAGINPTTKKTRKKKIGKAIVEKALSPFGGHPTTLTDAISRKLCEYLDLGGFIQTALAGEGIANSTYYAWVDLGERDRFAGKASIHTRFLEMIKKAETGAEMKNLRLVQEGGLGWQGNAWFLERRFPARWGNRMRLTLEEAQNFGRKMLAVLAEEIPDRVILERIVGKLRRIEGEQHDLVARST